MLDVVTAIGPLRVKNSHGGFWKWFASGTWEPETFAAFDRFIDPEHSYIDIGCWIGPTLLYGCRLAKRAYGIEADPVAYEELRCNVSANRPLTSNIQTFNVCIAPESGRVSFGSLGQGGDSMSSLLFSGAGTTWQVDGQTFEQFIEHNHITDCSFIKIDVEGGEYMILPTMTSYLKQHRPTVHLSVHPRFIAGLKADGWARFLWGTLRRLTGTVRLLRCLNFYRQLYNPAAKVGLQDGSSFFQRWRHRLDRVAWRPGLFLVCCLYSVTGNFFSLVATDSEWK